MKSVELKNQRAALVAEARQLIDHAESEKRDLSQDEQTTWERKMQDVDALAIDIQSHERKEKVEHVEAELRQTVRKTSPHVPSIVSNEERSEAFRTWAIAGTPEARVDSDSIYRAANCGYNPASRSLEVRALAKSTSGAPLPIDFVSSYTEKLKYYFPVMSAVSAISTATGQDMTFNLTDDTSNAASIITEAGTITAASDPTLSRVTMKAWKYASPIVKVSLELLQDSAVNVPQMLGELFASRFGRGYETAVVSANAGSAAPEGILYGLTAAVNLASGQPITLPKLIGLETSVDIAYRRQPGTGWLMHDATWAAIRQLADDESRPIFQIDLQNNVQPRLLGYPVFISNSMTSVTAATDNEPLIAFGDLSQYKWRTVAGRTLTRLDEIYCVTGEVGFCMLERADGRYTGFKASAVKTLNAYDAP